MSIQGLSWQRIWATWRNLACYVPQDLQLGHKVLTELSFATGGRDDRQIARQRQRILTVQARHRHVAMLQPPEEHPPPSSSSTCRWPDISERW